MDTRETKLTVLIAAGGTGGHVFPGVAIAEAIAAAEPTARIVFAGTSGGLEARLVPQAGWPIEFIGRHSTHGGGVLNRLFTYLKVPRALVAALSLIARVRPNVVVGTGGFAAGPVVLAAALKRIPSAIVEPNAVPGRANRWLSRFVRRVFVGFARTAKAFPVTKTMVTGNPVRQAIVRAEHTRSPNDPTLTVLCYGGSQGAQPLNALMVEAIPFLADMSERMRFIHQVGSVDAVASVANSYKRHGLEAEVFTFTDRIDDIYRETDIAIARAGAGTVAELAATHIPAILVPFPYAVDDHQQANAEQMAAMGGAVVIRQEDLDGKKLALMLKDFIENPEKLLLMQEALRVAAPGNASEMIARECIGLAHRAA